VRICSRKGNDIENGHREYPQAHVFIILNKPTYNAKVVCQKGNSPEQVFKVPKLMLSEIKEVFILILPGNRLRSGHFLKIS